LVDGRSQFRNGLNEDDQVKGALSTRAARAFVGTRDHHAGHHAIRLFIRGVSRYFGLKLGRVPEVGVAERVIELAKDDLKRQVAAKPILDARCAPRLKLANLERLVAV